MNGKRIDKKYYNLIESPWKYEVSFDRVQMVDSIKKQAENLYVNISICNHH